MNKATLGPRRLGAALALGTLLLLAACGDGGWAGYGGDDEGGPFGGMLGDDGYEEGGPGLYGMGMPYYGGGVGWGGFNYDQ